MSGSASSVSQPTASALSHSTPSSCSFPSSASLSCSSKPSSTSSSSSSVHSSSHTPDQKVLGSPHQKADTETKAAHFDHHQHHDHCHHHIHHHHHHHHHQQQQHHRDQQQPSRRVHLDTSGPLGRSEVKPHSTGPSTSAPFRSSLRRLGTSSGRSGGNNASLIVAKTPATGSAANMEPSADWLVRESCNDVKTWWSLQLNPLSGLQLPPAPQKPIDRITIDNKRASIHPPPFESSLTSNPSEAQRSLVGNPISRDPAASRFSPACMSPTGNLRPIRQSHRTAVFRTASSHANWPTKWSSPQELAAQSSHTQTGGVLTRPSPTQHQAILSHERVKEAGQKKQSPSPRYRGNIGPAHTELHQNQVHQQQVPLLPLSEEKVIEGPGSLRKKVQSYQLIMENSADSKPMPSSPSSQTSIAHLEAEEPTPAHATDAQIRRPVRGQEKMRSSLESSSIKNFSAFA
ncbi:unnamed protein product [Protopolystoma xenopodis]|uniref:Uncharacterized protein n=1 Tax=Protopolystoma xenopodis TaxID=117903 RepID=A0A3S5A3E2_9PLAT|nr:unnamed protein product [Protopolystoma xenopodis]